MIKAKAIVVLSMIAFRTSTGLIIISSCRQVSYYQAMMSSFLAPSIVRENIVGRNKPLLFSTLSSDNGNMEEEEDMVNVTLETASKQTTIKVQKGEILRTALLRRGASPHNGRSRLINCRGLGTCGTCAVEIEGSDAIAPRERNTKERLRLNFPPHGSPNQSLNLRLACQIQVEDDVLIRKRTGFWGQDSGELAEAYDAELWFGDLEFVLDNKSPPKW